jgi:hypothetical protein
MDGQGDPFFANFFARIPTDVAASFTPAQLNARDARVRRAQLGQPRHRLPQIL